jgi:MoaA/NifB/PqqE/SkfB family radical SAM enzyme
MSALILHGCTLLDGFHSGETDLVGSFRWTKKRFSIRLTIPTRFLLLHMCYYGERGGLRIRGSEIPSQLLEIKRGWKTYVVDLRVLSRGILRFALDLVIPVEDDSRKLGLMVRQIEGFTCPHRFEALAKQIRNETLNVRERQFGKTVLRSVPPRLRISVETKCNIYPRCVYCEWDWAKALEAKTKINFSVKTLDGLGSFYALATEIVDCSYGEPFLNRNLRDLLEDFHRLGKRFEMTSNAQIMNSSQQDLLLGKSLILNISLDAANAKGYRRYRNDKFDTLVRNVRQLCQKKKSHSNLPTVIVSFIAMKSNVSEFSDFLDLVKDLGVDAVKLRSLYHEGVMIEEEVKRAGYTFKYQDQVLDLESLRNFTLVAKEIAKGKGVSLLVEIDDFQKGTLESTGPLCNEPWDSIYVLNRGILPCCFGKKPIATLDGVPPEKLGDFLAHVFNGKEYQALRESLAKRKLSKYCRESNSCPIVKKVITAEQST